MIQDLGTLANMPSCTATAISQSGQVTGYCTQAGGSIITGAATRGFLYSKGNLTDMGPSPKQSLVPTGVNDSGVVVGTYIVISFTTGLNVSPFIYQNGAIQTYVGVQSDFLPFGITNSGLVAGSDIAAGSLNFFGSSQAVQIASPGSPPTMLAGVNGSQTVVFGVSSANDWVAGTSVNVAGSELTTITSTLWHNGTAQGLPRVPGFTYSLATGANDSGMASGYGFSFNFAGLIDPNASSHAVLYNNGAVTDLGVLAGDQSSAAIGINNDGTVVGYSSSLVPSLTLHTIAYLGNASSNTRAFVYSNGVMSDLNRQLVNGTGWQLSFATAINNAGQIAGTGVFQQQQHAFLLTPASGPEINANGVVGAGLSNPPVNSLSANGMFTVFGTAFTDPSVKRNVTGSDLTNNALPTNLANTCVQGGTARWGLLYVSATQINAVADPFSTSGTVPVSVITNCGMPNETATAAVNVTVAAETPQFFLFGTIQDGQSEVAALDALSNAKIGPPGFLAGVTTTPAHGGEILTAYGAGWGTTTPAAVVGSLAAGAATITGKYTLTVGGKPADVSYAGLSPTYAGLYQINFTVPDGLTPGNQPIVLTIDGVATPTGAYIAVQ